jgi:predicted alpha/beta superfamily hydrolase
MKASIIAACCLLSASAYAQSLCKSTVTGDLRIETFQSMTYGEGQTLRVWLPPGYTDAANAQKRYPVLYMLDGQTLFDACTAFANEQELQVDETVTRLIAENKIPPIVVVGIDSSAKRNYQYSPYRDVISAAAAPEPIGKQLPAFLANEVLPYISARYRVTADAGETGIGGSSVAGVAALYVLVNRPDLFGLGLIQSPTLLLGNGQLLRDTAPLARGPDRIYIGVGTTELAVPGGDNFAAGLRLSLDDANAGFAKMSATMAENLKAAYIKHADVMFVMEPKANHTSASWARRFPQAVTFLYGSH